MITSINAIRVHVPGGPEALTWERVSTPRPGPGEVLIRNSAIGLNFLDTYLRSGRYPHPTPFVPGNEGAGVVEEVGAGVTNFVVGDRVGYVDPLGAYAELTVRPVARLIKLPDDVDFVTAAAMLLKGITAEYLVRRTYQVQPGDTILVHGAAGGVGQILCQWASYIGATVIGTVGATAKREAALQAGCDRVIVTAEEDFVSATRAATAGEGVDVVYDGVGADTFEGSLKCVKTRGLVAAFGAASGPIPPLNVQSLGALGSIYVTRPGINAYTRTAEELNHAADALFAALRDGAVARSVPRTYALKDAAMAHSDLEGRRTTGSSIFLP